MRELSSCVTVGMIDVIRRAGDHSDYGEIAADADAFWDNDLSGSVKFSNASIWRRRRRIFLVVAHTLARRELFEYNDS